MSVVTRQPSIPAAVQIPPSRAQLTADLMSGTVRREQLLSSVQESQASQRASLSPYASGAFTSLTSSEARKRSVGQVRRDPVRKSDSARLRDGKA